MLYSQPTTLFIHHRKTARSVHAPSGCVAPRAHKPFDGGFGMICAVIRYNLNLKYVADTSQKDSRSPSCTWVVDPLIIYCKEPPRNACITYARVVL